MIGLEKGVDQGEKRNRDENERDREDGCRTEINRQKEAEIAGQRATGCDFPFQPCAHSRPEAAEEKSREQCHEYGARNHQQYRTKPVFADLDAKVGRSL